MRQITLNYFIMHQKLHNIYTALLLLSVMLFSLTGALHLFLHESDESCLETAHCCLIEQSGDTTAWSTPVHQPLQFDAHRLCCPLCSGIGFNAVPVTGFALTLTTAPEEFPAYATPELHGRKLYRPRGRAPPERG